MARARKKGIIDGDRRFHAVVFKVTGAKALCGAGRIALTLPDRFDPDDSPVCPECASLSKLP